MKTGVFFHQEFSLKGWPIIGNQYQKFSKVMKNVLSLIGTPSSPMADTSER